MKNPCRHLLPWLRLAVFAALAGCASAPAPRTGLTRMEQAELERRERRLDDSPQRVRDTGLDAYLRRVLERLEPATPVRILVLDRSETQADLLGGQVLVLRTGLLSQLRDEAELAFVLAHELAHRTLEHVAARRREDWDARAAELAADRVALQTSLRAGYRDTAGADLLRRLLGSTRDPGARELVQARVDALPYAAQAAAAADAEFQGVMARYRRTDRAGRAD